MEEQWDWQRTLGHFGEESGPDVSRLVAEHEAKSGVKDAGVTVLVLIKLKEINATAPQPQRNVLMYFALFKNVARN